MPPTRDKHGRFSTGERDRVRTLQRRVRAATRIYTRWEERFRCKTLLNYWVGEQWSGVPEEEARDRYTINLIYPTVEIKLPSLLFDTPTVKITPRPTHADDPGSTAPDRARLAEETIQTLIDTPSVYFREVTTLGLRDAEWRFAVVEVGYSASWIDNPNADKPVLRDDGAAMRGRDGAEVRQPARLVESETVYVKRIPPSAFRVSPSNRNILEQNDWVGYYEWHYLDDVKANPAYRGTADLKGGAVLRDDEPVTTDEAEGAPKSEMVKLWKIWDLRAKERIVLAEDHPKELAREPFTRLPIAALRYVEIPDQWYPLPPLYNLIGPQDAINESREAERHRQRHTKRRYTTVDGEIDPQELEKLEQGPDGVVARQLRAGSGPGGSALIPVTDPVISGDTWRHLAITFDDFQRVAGVGGEQQGVNQADSATQANIIDVRARIRESTGRLTVAHWLSEVCRLLFETLREHAQLPFWIQVHTDPQAPGQESQRVAQEWRRMTAAGLGKQWTPDVTVDVPSLSPVAEDQARKNWLEVLALLVSPLIPVLMQSELILKKTLAFYGVTSDQEIQAFRQAAEAVMVLQQAGPAAGGSASGALAAGGQASGPGLPAGLPAAGPTLQ